MTLWKFAALVFSYYMIVTLFSGAFQGGGTAGPSVCLIGASMWTAIAICIYPPFKNKPVEDRED